MAAAAVANRDTEQYHRVSREKEEILYLLRKRGFRVTKQRELILDIVFEHECASCKEIYYQAIQHDPGIGMATVYRMVNTLTDIGVLKVATLKPQTALGSGSGCQILLKNQNKIVLKKSGRFFYFRKEQKLMQIFLLSIIFVLICVLVYQGREIRNLERKIKMELVLLTVSICCVV